MGGTIDVNNPKVSIRGFFTCHPQYSSRNNDYDFSIIEMVSEVALGENELDIATIAIPQQDYPAGTPAMITGWGRTHSQIHYHPDILQMAMTTLKDISECKKTFPIGLTDQMQCVGGDGINSACFGDSGGPLAVYDTNGVWYLVGNTSFGTQDCDTSAAGIFSKNYMVKDWIEATISATA